MEKFLQLIDLIKKSLESQEMQDFVAKYLHDSYLSDEWILLSDYCLDDQKKPNDIISFCLMPFITDDIYKEIEEKIKETQPIDIKKTGKISSEFLALVRNEAFFSFNFIINDRASIFGKDKDEQKRTVEKILKEFKKTYDHWAKNADNKEIKDYYLENSKKIQAQLNELFKGKNVKLLMDIILVSCLGAIYSGTILRMLPDIKVFGWLPDRDKISEAFDNIAVTLFLAEQYAWSGCRQYQFTSAQPDSKLKPFYDDFNRVADVICGTLADYNLDEGLVSADKFSTVLKKLLADNSKVKIYKITQETDGPHLKDVLISLTPFDEQ